MHEYLAGMIAPILMIFYLMGLRPITNYLYDKLSKYMGDIMASVVMMLTVSLVPVTLFVLDFFILELIS